MAGIKAIGRRRTGPAGLRIVGALLAVGFVYNLAPAAVLNADVAERHVLDGVSLHAGDDDACQRIAVVGYHIIYIYIACRRHIGAFLRSAVAAARSDVDGIMVHVAHRDVGHHDVLHASLVNLLESQSAAPHTGAIGNGDIAVAAIALGTELDTATHPVHLLGHIRSVEEGAQLKPCDDAVGDENMFTEHRPLEGIRALQHNGVVVGGVHLGVAHGEILAAVDVDTITVGVDGDIVDGPNVAASGNDGEVTATENGDITDKHIAAQLEGNGLVARADAATLHIAGILGVMTGEAVTVDHALSGDAHVVLPLGPYQTIMKIGVSAILVLWPAKHLTLVVGLHRGRGCQNGSTSHEVQVDITLQPDAATEIGSYRHEHLTTAARHTGIDGAVDGGMVERLSVALGTVVAHIIHSSGLHGCKHHPRHT